MIDEPAEDRAAAAAFANALALCHELGIEPARVAPLLQAQLLAIYGVDTRAPLPVIMRALGAWRPASTTLVRDGALTLRATRCPIEARAAADRDVCRACKHLQRELLVQGLGADRDDIRFPRTLTSGDDACEVLVPIRASGEP